MSARPDDAAGNAEHPGNEHDDVKAVPPPARVSEGAHISSFAQYQEVYKRSIEQPEAFWAAAAREHLAWFRDFTEVCVALLLNGCCRWILLRASGARE